MVGQGERHFVASRQWILQLWQANDLCWVQTLVAIEADSPDVLSRQGIPELEGIQRNQLIKPQDHLWVRKNL